MACIGTTQRRVQGAVVYFEYVCLNEFFRLVAAKKHEFRYVTGVTHLQGGSKPWRSRPLITAS